MTVRRRKFIRIISYLVAVCIVFAASGIFSAKAKSDYESTLERVRLEGLNSLTEYSREISSGLRLLAVSAEDSLTDSSSYVSSRAVGALGSLGCFYSEKVDNLTRFFSGVYDFSESFAGNEESRKAAVKLSDYALEIYYHLSDLTNAVLNGEYALTEYRSIYEKSKTPYFEDVLDFYNGTEDEIFGIIAPAASVSGGFSLLEGKESISLDEAKQKASDIAGIPQTLWRNRENSGSGTEIYSLTNGDIEIDICKSGGMLFGIINPQPCNPPAYSADDAHKKAVEFLEIYGFENMTELYRRQDMFTVSFVFVPEVNGVLLLTSKTEIEICLASGRVTYFNAEEYIKRYRTDISIPNGNPDITSLLPYGLTAEKTIVCLSDIEGREKLCILAVCPFENNNVYIFFDYYSLKIIKTVM